MAYCGNCGAEVPDGMKFCSNCGAKMGEQDKVQGEIVQSNVESGSYTPAENSFYVKPGENRQLANVERQKKEKSNKAAGYWNIGIVVGIISIAIAIFGLLNHKTWPSTFMSVFALILGIICLVKKSRLPGFAIAGIALAVINFMTYSWGYDHAEKERVELEQQVESLQEDLIKAETAAASKPLGTEYKVVPKGQSAESDDVTRADAADADAGSETEESATDESAADADDKESTGGVDPDLKAFLDSYEQFMDEYIDFMQKYTANPTDLSLLGEYADMMEKAAEFEEKVDKYDSDEMSTADAAYYLEVTGRVTQKMLKIYSN